MIKIHRMAGRPTGPGLRSQSGANPVSDLTGQAGPNPGGWAAGGVSLARDAGLG
jgi:hypothetical protein